MEEEIVVSIICNTFNQELYIAQTIEGFIKQETEFRYEVLIHDDASTDNTQRIIREYEMRYPDIIKPIYQKYNQYSKGISVTNTYQLPRAKGKYIAICEGDDYWTDKYKLKTQVQALEKHPRINICAHPVSILRNERVDGVVRPFKKDLLVLPEQVILYGGSFVGTCSILYRRSMDDFTPEFRKFLSMDYTIQIHGALEGGLLYIDKNMACYRIGSNGSWTNSVLRVPQKAIEHYELMERLLEMIDKNTSCKYSNVISFVKNEYEFKKAFALGDKENLKSVARKLTFIKNLKVYRLYSVKASIKTGIKYQFPFLYKYLHKK